MSEKDELDKEESQPPDTSGGDKEYITSSEVHEIINEFVTQTDNKIDQLRIETKSEIQEVKATTRDTNNLVQQLKLSIASVRTSQNLATLFTGIFVTILMKIINHFFK